MRRLPIVFLLDVSESMVGENLQHLEEGLARIVRLLRTNPHALETVHLAVIAFAGVAKTLVPLLELMSFYPPRLPLGSGTALGTALMHLMQELDRMLVKSSPQQKGDWKPIVYLLTDGKPTDTVDEAIRQWHARWAKKCDLIAIALGRHADTRVLKQLTEQVLVLENTRDEAFNRLTHWVSTSVQLQSQSVGMGQEHTPLANIEEQWGRWVKDVPPPSTAVDEDYVILVGRCQKSRAPYLLRYERERDELRHESLRLRTDFYQFAGAFPLTEEYFTWSDPSASGQRVHTQELLGAPSCPHCGNVSAFALCGCGGLMCVKGPGIAVCPWCRQTVEFIGQSEGFDVQRGRG